MPDGDLLRVLRALTQAAARFEKVAAKHHRIEAERKALQEALTDAQLVLSLQQRKPLAEVRSLKAGGDRKGSGKPEGKDRR
jgi:imidazoleglycerol phosphate dehydratase HisB